MTDVPEDTPEAEASAEGYEDFNEPPFEEPADVVVSPGDPTPNFDFSTVPEPEPEAPAESDGTEQYEPFDLIKARPSAFDPVDEEGNLDLKSGKPRLRDDEGNVLPTFDEKYKEDFYGLAFIGALSKTFEWLGHKFVIRTITVDEALMVSLLTKQFSESLGSGLAYRTAVAALAVQQIDNKDLPIPVGEDGDLAYAQQRFDYAKARWFQFTVDAIYNEYLELEYKTHQVVDAMGKAYGQTASTSG